MSAGQPGNVPRNVSPVIAAPVVAAPIVANPGDIAPSQPHAPPDDSESVYFDGRPMLGGKAAEVLGLSFAGIMLLLGPVILRVVLHHWPATFLSVALVVVGIILLITPAVITKQVRYRVSNYRIDYERGFFSKDISTLELWHVEDIAFHQSIIDRVLGIGTIRVISKDDSMPDLHMHGVPNARKIFEELKQRVIAVKRQSGVMKVDTGN